MCNIPGNLKLATCTENTLEDNLTAKNWHFLMHGNKQYDRFT